MVDILKICWEISSSLPDNGKNSAQKETGKYVQRTHSLALHILTWAFLSPVSLPSLAPHAKRLNLSMRVTERKCHYKEKHHENNVAHENNDKSS